MMLDDIIHFTKDESVGFLMVLSLFRNDIPWIYDLGSDTVKNIKGAKSIKEKMASLHNFERILDYSIHNPYFEEMMVRNKDDYRLFRELPHMLLRTLHRMIEHSSTKE